MLITGATGMLGTALTALCDELGIECHPFAEADLDITDAAAVLAVAELFAAHGGRLIVNAAAYTDVERAEGDEARAFAVNDRGAKNVAEAAARCGLGLVHVSTDFVFDGAKKDPYTEEDEPHPLNAYGRSKLAGERSVQEAYPAALIVRTAWVYGPGGNNFPKKILELAQRRDELQVVDDEIGSPTFTGDLARGILQLSAQEASGVFHLTGSGSCSRYEMAEEIVKSAGLPTRLARVSSKTFPTKAQRPLNSVLSTDKARSRGVDMPPWRDSLRAYVQHYLHKAA
jgi:dTDP-4-dehydrorhamnose reductase